MRLSQLPGLMRESVLQALFPPAMAWSLFLLFADEIGRLQRLNPFPEGGVGHNLFEGLVDWPLAILLGIAMAVWLLRRRTGFLRLPQSASITAIAVRLAVHGVALFVVITVVAVVVSYLFYDPVTDPQGQFHIWVWAGGLLYATTLAPPSAILSAWMALRGKRGESQ